MKPLEEIIRDNERKAEEYRLFKRKTKRAWSLMRYRCLKPTSPDYSNYGGRGIGICEEWEDVDTFVQEMGIIPFLGATLERLDTSGNYCKANCRWATRDEQARNKRNTNWVNVSGELICLSEAARRFRINRSTLAERIKRGWSKGEAIITPVGEKRRRYGV